MRIIPSKPDLPSTELMELHQINSIEHHTDHGEWKPRGLREQVWSHEKMMRILKGDESDIQ